MRIAVLMLNLGGPWQLADVRPFLRNLFSDREIIRFPGGRLGQRFFSWLIAKTKSPSSAANYAAIGGGSPLLDWTEKQGQAMCDAADLPEEVELKAFPCMRYWHPSSEQALAAAVDFGADHIIAFSQYPHESVTTSGSSFADLERSAQRMGIQQPITRISGWHAHSSYIDALAETVVESSRDLIPDQKNLVLYSAHSLPMKFVEDGDLYPVQIRASVALTHAKSGVDLEHELSWQSKVGPVRWLAPSTANRIPELAAQGVQGLVVVPVSFVNDHIETLHELDIELREIAKQAGIRQFIRAPGLNTRPSFIKALADIVGEHIQDQISLRMVVS
ncbi:MAG: ferrochelatase [Planctomycetota bacterium]|jgi:ferrochelatase